MEKEVIERVLRALYEVKAALREGNTIIAELVVDDQITKLEMLLEQENRKLWWWP